MPYQGHCNCGSIQITLEKQPAESIVCHCHNCRRAGGAFSVNYVVNNEDIQLSDERSSLKMYSDSNTTSGTTITRKFCGNCGSPVLTVTPSLEGKAFLKASLFDEISHPSAELFAKSKEGWVQQVEGAKQQ
ncbi:Mss4-like protein [Xylariaceae sp. FL0016]|nr:Mss4-like protein [Xylariaceae sp. FL0016]